MSWTLLCPIFLEFLDYFEKTYLKSYKIEYWNYYNKIDHIINNASESYNNYLKNIVSKKNKNFIKKKKKKKKKKK